MRRLLPSKIQIEGEVVLLGGVLLTSLLLRLPFLGQTSLWLDEMCSIGISRMPWRSVLSVVLHQDSNMSLYYALLHFWIGLGESEATVRFLSVFFAVATLPILYVLGNRLFGTPVGLIACLLLAVNGFHIRYSQEARGYSLVVLLTTLSSAFFVMCVMRPLRRNWCAYILTSVLAIYTHLFAVLVVASHWASLIFLRRREVPWKELWASTAAIGLLASPLGLLMFARTQEATAPLGWVPKPTLRSFYDLFYWLLGAGVGASSGRRVVGAYFVVCLVALLSGIKVWRSSGRSFPSWRLGLLVCWLFVPIALVFAASTIKPVLVYRFLLICIPPLALLAAEGIRSIRPSLLAATSLAAIVALTAFALPPYYHSRYLSQEWKEATDYLLVQAHPGDAAIFCIAPGRLLFDYYRGRYEGSAKELEVAYPDFGDETKDPGVLAYLPPVNSGLVDHIAAHHHRVWLILYHDWDAEPRRVSHRIRAELSEKYRNIQQNRIEGDRGEEVTLFLYANDSGDEERKSHGSTSPEAIALSSER